MNYFVRNRLMALGAKVGANGFFSLGFAQGFTALIVAAGTLGFSPLAAAGEQGSSAPMEEVVVQGRLRSSAESLVDERIDDEVVTDYLGAEMIGRIGDSTVASALRRVAGLSVVNDKFVYVRGLGERYSSTLLNGGSVPSPDLTRSVIPLDIFPTSIVESLAVQKSYSADMPAEFGGGNINIRTKGIPADFTYSLEVGSGFNSESSGKVLTYKGGSDDEFGKDDGTRALSGEITDALQRFRGDLSVASILDTIRNSGDAGATVADARAINRDLALNLNRDISIESDSVDPDIDVSGSIGNSFNLRDDLELGFLMGGSYSNKWRETETLARDFQFPEERFETENETTHTVDITGSVNAGLRFTDDHQISTNTLFLRNTDDEAALIDNFNENRERSDGAGFRKSRVKFEQRDLEVYQIEGRHFIGRATKDKLPILAFLPKKTEDLQFRWRYSDSEATTDIPNEVTVQSDTITDPVTGDVLESRITVNSTAADYRFTDLKDDVLNHGWDLELPVHFGNMDITFAAGYEYNRKARTYRQFQFSLGALSVSDPGVLDGPIDEVFSDDHITDPANDFVFDVTGSNTQSYIAATVTDASYGKFDLIWDNRWRLSAGVRREDYRQAVVDWNVVGFTLANPQVSGDPDELASGVFTDDDFYPSVALTYMQDFFLWAETFQLRFGYSETVVRPDLRELTDAEYIDPLTGATVVGNPDVRPSDMRNFDMRAEWFFASGENLTISAYYKDISRPIEFFEAAASDTNIAREIVNAKKGEVYGVEIEFLKNMDFLGRIGQPFFVTGNLTLQDSELDAGNEADAPTNKIRPLSNASEYVANLLVGYDSANGKHAATVGYNVYGERLSFAGRNGAPDGFEQPFHSVDLTYFWYPFDTLTLKLKLRNALNETITIQRQGVNIFEEDAGTSLALNLRWAF